MKNASVQAIFHQYNKKKKHVWLHVIEVILFLIFLIFCTGFIYENINSKADLDKFKVKGKMVDVGGYKLFYRNTGEGKATVVMDSNVGDPSSEWSKITETLSKTMKVIAYDRAGYGWSEPGEAERDISAAVKDLHTVLKKSAAKSPYIFIGHGYGGLVMMNYAKQYASEVGALILIDTPAESYMKTEEYQKNIDKKLKDTKLYTYSSMLGVVRLADKYNKFEVNTKLLDNLTGESKEFYRACIVTNKYNKTLYSEYNILKGYSGDTQAPGLMGDKPVYILTSPHQELSTDKQNKWLESQKELLGISTNAENIVVDDSSTYVQFDKPDVIISTVNAIIKKWQNK